MHNRTPQVISIQMKRNKYDENKPKKKKRDFCGLLAPEWTWWNKTKIYKFSKMFNKRSPETQKQTADIKDE